MIRPRQGDRHATIHCTCAFLLVLGLLGHDPAHAASDARTSRVPASAALTIGVIYDPVSVVNATMWAMLELARIMQLADEVAEHIKDDIRRQQHPQRTPRVVPVQPPDLPELAPTRRLSPPSARPQPITDTLPARSTS